MEQVTPCKGSSLFSDETILFTPLPKATSTVDKRPDLLPQPEIFMNISKESPEVKNNFLSDGFSQINELRQKLDSLVLNKSSCGTGISTTDVVPTTSTFTNIADSKFIMASNIDFTNNIKINPDCNVNVVKGSLTATNTSLSKQAMAEISNLNCNDNMYNSASCSLQSSKILSNIPAYSEPNISLPVDLNISGTSVANFSLPARTNSVYADQDSRSIMMPSFNPLTQVSEDIKRNTFTLNNVGSEDSERNNAREKALKILNSMGVLPANDSGNSSITSIQQHKSFDMTPENDVSGFSQLMNKSDFQKDESWCAANFGLPIKPGEESWSFLSSSQVSLNFMPEDDSLFRELGPADPPKYRDITNNSECTMRESSRVVKDIFPELDSHVSDTCSFMSNLGDYLQSNQPPFTFDNSCKPAGISTPRDEDSPDSVIRVSEIAKALQDIPLDATPNSLAKKVMELSDKLTTSDNRTFRGSNKSDQCYYEASAVYGSVAQVELTTENVTPQTLWKLEDIDSGLVRAVIKSGESPVKVLMFPFVKRTVILKVQEVDFDRDGAYFSRLHVIKLNVENPKIEIVGSPEINFGLVPECGSVMLPLTIRNKNSSVAIIFPKFELDELSPFLVALDEEAIEEIHLPPNQDVEVKIGINPIIGFCVDPQQVSNIIDKLKLCLSSMVGSEVLFKIPLRASVFRSGLQINMHNMGKPISVGEGRQLAFRNASPCPINITLHAKGEFSTSVSYLTLLPCQIGAVTVTFSPHLNNNTLEGELILTVVPGGLNYNLKLQGSKDPLPIPKDVPSRKSSYAGTANSSMNNSGEPEGSLQLECTAGFLVWPSVTLGTVSSIKSCFIRSKGMFKEKLSIEIVDPSNSFYLVTNELERKKTDMAVLNPQEKKQISVEFSPKLLGQLRAQVLVKRVKFKDDGDSKQVILNGFGGSANLRAHNMVMDLESRHFTLALQENFSQQFTLQNCGDGVAFFSITQKNLEEMHLEVSPARGLISPAESHTINLTLKSDSPGWQSALFQKLLSRDTSEDVILSSLTITYGDEPSRLRLARLFRKHKNQAQFKKSPQVTKALKNLTELFPVNKQKLECIANLKDPLSSLSDLFEEGIQELTINVITRRKTIEDANLEVTQQFVSFSEANQLDDTEYNTFFDITHPSHHTLN